MVSKVTLCARIFFINLYCFLNKKKACAFGAGFFRQLTVTYQAPSAINAPSLEPVIVTPLVIDNPTRTTITKAVPVTAEFVS